MKRAVLFSLLLSLNLAEAKTFQNSYVSFEVPDNWTCLQEGVAWTCTPSHPVAGKEAVIVLAAKVAGPEDNLTNFLTLLKEPKKIKTHVGTTMPSQVMYAQQRVLAGLPWIQAQHLGSEIQEFYTLYLATVKDQLAILVSFSAEKNKYAAHNPVFDRAIKTLKIVANQKLLMAKNQMGPNEQMGIQGGGPTPLGGDENLIPPPERKTGIGTVALIFAVVALILGLIAWYLSERKSKTSPPKRKAKGK